MQKYFTKEISQALKVIVLGLGIGLGVSFVSANWTAPIGTAPTCAAGNPGCDAPINISTNNQSKGNGIQNIGNTFNVYGTSSADQLWGFDGLTVGAPSTLIANDAAKLFSTLTINKSAYPDTSTDARGRNLIELLGSANSGDSVGIIQNKPWFFFWQYGPNNPGSRAGIRAGNGDFTGTMNIGAEVDPQEQDPLLQVNRGGSVGFTVNPGPTAAEVVRSIFNGKIQIKDGTQGTDKVLTSDSNGLATWQSPWMTAGNIEVNSAGTANANGINGPGVSTVSVSCLTPGSMILSGGGACNRYSHTGPIDIQPAMIKSSGDIGMTSGQWTVSCAAPAGAGFYAYAQILCIKPAPSTNNPPVNPPNNPPVDPDAGWTVQGNSYLSADNQSCIQALGNHTFRVKRTYNGVVAYLNNQVVRTNVSGGSAFLVVGAPNSVNGRCSGGGTINTSNNSDPFEGATVQLQYQ